MIAMNVKNVINAINANIVSVVIICKMLNTVMIMFNIRKKNI